MRALVIAVCASVACARPRPASVESRPASVESPPADAVMAPDDRAAGDAAGDEARVAMLRALVAASRGADQLDARARLFEQLAASAQPADQVEALAIAAALVAAPGFAALPQADAVLYGHGAALARAGDGVGARGAWRRLVADYPASRWVPPAIVELADQAFAAGDLNTATALYPRAFADPAVGVYARYKRGWCAYNLGDGAQALADFLDVARTARDPLRTAALKDLVRAYADVGDVAKAAAFFRVIDRAHVGAHQLRLGQHYLDIGKLREARRALTDAQPLLAAADACRAEATLARAAWLGGDRSATAAALTGLVARGPDPTCADVAAPLAREVAIALTADARRRVGDRAAAIAAWGTARALAPAGAPRADAAQALAEVAAEHATAVGTAAAWAEAAEAAYEAAASGDAGAVDAALDAWRRAVALDPGLAARAAAGRALLERLPCAGASCGGADSR